MKEIRLPQGYRPLLSIYETQRAIDLGNRLFADKLAGALRLHRVSAPLFVSVASGLNDDLNGVERAVAFDINGVEGDAAVVHSLAKWKRFALKRYQFHVGEGLYTNMNAIRRDEELDSLHSAYVDQWDWEKIIDRSERNVDFLKQTVRSIVNALCETQSFLRTVFPQLNVLPLVSDDITFVTAQELEDLFPGKTPKEREDAFVKDHPTTFLMGIGGALRSGRPHDGRAPDYDDWELNGDLLVWDSVGQRSFEISSMGIRVDEESMERQLKLAGCEDRRALPFHRMLLNGELPLTMGGGIGQSRVSMLLLGKAHIGEVQSSLWDEDNIRAAEAAGITLL
ncbi:MAG: aspartate--ammonia ligase [Lawsonibacter sp.]|jgi:aspartate--ammonia ligase|nr:aspartate--ammonia ligase [Lawsonibacter sp.]MCI9026411.1 aspartate--ammonia ligase [Lawsonibacter sp.]MCI9654696.1 aspartate--ammonia ligase [Lawsonibacter sp.]MDE6898317.1 aspartate--ammonia ligase [Lawsonibacter sp.]